MRLPATGTVATSGTAARGTSLNDIREVAAAMRLQATSTVARRPGTGL